MNRETDFTDALAKGQVFYPDPDRCFFWERDDGSSWMAGEIDGVLYLGPFIEVPDGTLPGGAGVAGVIRTAPSPAGVLPKLKRAFESPELDGAAISELFADPDVRAIVGLMNLRTTVIEEVDRLVDGLGEALCLGPDESARSCSRTPANSTPRWSITG